VKPQPKYKEFSSYRIKGTNKYLTLVEAQGGQGWRYFKAYTAETLSGKWTPIVATKTNAFASMGNTRPIGSRWTDSISHGELIREGFDEQLVVSAENLRFLFQGVSDLDRSGKSYGEIPWKLGLLEQNAAAVEKP